MYKKDAFTNLLRKSGSKIIPYKNRTNGRNIYENIKGLKRMSEYLPFDCQFKNGLCKTNRKRKNDNPMCCCHDCFYTIGYLKYVAEKDLWYYAQRFKKNIGFWREGKGCILDREMRSSTCLSHTCHEYGSPEDLMFDGYRVALTDLEVKFFKFRKNAVEWERGLK